eukprot:scaffold1579_cov102-Skeletonema_dohrnii-CCMP3373.AAC.9
MTCTEVAPRRTMNLVTDVPSLQLITIPGDSPTSVLYSSFSRQLIYTRCSFATSMQSQVCGFIINDQSSDIPSELVV